MKLLVRITISITFVCIYCLGVWISGIELERGETGVYLFIFLIFTAIAGITLPFKEIVNNFNKED